MSIQALQDYTYYSKYARYNRKLKRRDTWVETVERVRNMHLSRFPQAREQIEWAFNLVKDKRVLGSQRALQFGGHPILSKHARIYNCTVSFCDRIRFFQECFWLLLCGCGTGFSAQKHHVAKLPEFATGLGSKGKKTFVIPDTIEGWADALGVLLATYFPHPDFPEWEGYTVEFDYSLVRPAGSPLASSVGKAPGPEPLKRSLEIIRQLLDRCIAAGQKRLRPLDAYDIVMHASDAVLSGGVRRSATICLFSPDDMEMATAKTGNWFNENPQRGRSNNSALLVRGSTTREQFAQLMKCVREYGEPGFVWSDSTELVVNPCVEIGMWPVCVETGLSGWQMCNLCEINGRMCKTEEDFMLAAQAAAIIGTLQASYSDFDYLGPVTKRIVDREALLGVSITGMMDNPGVLFNEEIQRKVARKVVETNEQFAPVIGVRPAARCTCVKPAGTTSCILGTGSGIHPHHAKRYFRRTQGNVMEAPLQHYKKFNPRAVEKSVWSANGTDEVVTFCIDVPEEARTKSDLTAIQLLEHVKLTQMNWVEYGTVQERCTAPWLRHNVSNTINVRPDEWDAVEEFIYENRQYFAGISMLSMSGDLDYPQAPMCSVKTPDETVKEYGQGSLMASGLIVDGLHAFDGNLWKACEAANGVAKLAQPSGKPKPTKKLAKFAHWVSKKTGGFVSRLAKFGVTNLDRKYHDEVVEYLDKVETFILQADWIRRAEQFAHRYFDGDVKRMTYCLKDVHNWKLWCDLKREYVEVDFTTMHEETDNTKVAQEWACSGGKCDVL